MKVILLAGFLFLFLSMKAQDTPRTDSASYSIDSSKRNVSYDTLKYDSTHDMYGDLLNDDPQYNPRYKWYIPATRVIMTNIFNWATAKYVFHYDWPASSISDWKNNLKKGWEWDSDKFGINFIGHPHSGNYYFNVGRSNELMIRFQFLDECGECEEINDHEATAPSKRIERVFPAYRKGSGIRAHAPIIVKRVGVDRLR